MGEAAEDAEGFLGIGEGGYGAVEEVDQRAT